MHESPRPERPRILTGARCAVLGLVIAGCNTPTAPPDPPEGGQTFRLDYNRFEELVLPVLTQRGCDAGGGCHGGGIRGTYQLSPRDGKDPQFDFEQSVLQVNGLEPEASPLLVKPLSVEAGGDPHGITVFSSTDDPGYVAILTWIEERVFE